MKYHLSGVENVKKILIIRHAETDLNNKPVFRGLADIPLNEAGMRQAELLGKYLKDESLEAVYTSPLQRAYDTAARIALPHGLEPIKARELIDFDYGEWQGLTHKVVKERYPAIYNEWETTPQLTRIPGGESLANVSLRVSTLLNRMMVQHQGAVAVVTHSVIAKVLICVLLELDNSHFWNLKIDNCGITTFLYQNERFMLEKHNDTHFLDALLRRVD